jgi:fucose 4-O-acetylase-like acetyltransferase
MGLEKSMSRNYLFDNIRALLIFCVVVGHMLTEQLGETETINTIYSFIYFFHMPAFIFISGYFSKNLEKSRNNAVQAYFVPFVVLNVLFWFLGKVNLVDLSVPFRILNPVWGMWFYLSLFIWKFMLKDLVRIRYILPISFMVGILSGLSDEFSLKLSLARIISFLPFFLLGYFCDEIHIQKIRKIPKLLTSVIMIGSVFFAYYYSKVKLFKKEYLYMRKPFNSIKDDYSSMESVLIRFLIYIIAILIIICLINLITMNKTKFSIMGQNSVTVYILHLFVVSNLRRLSLPWDKTNYYLIYTAIVSLAITYFFSKPFIINIYNNVMEKINNLLFKND